MRKPVLPRSVAIVVVVAVVTAACGSTARQGTVDAVGREDGFDPSLDSELDSELDEGSPSSPRSGRTSSIPGSERSGSVSQAPTADPATTGSPSGAPASDADGTTGMGKGVTATTIKLGFTYIDEQGIGAAEEAFGVSDFIVKPEDPRGPAQAAIDYVNARGGIAGRTVEPVWFAASFAESLNKASRARQAQRACATFTEDHEVFAFPGSTMYMEPNILECAVRNETPLIDSNDTAAGLKVSERQFAAVSDYYYHLTGMLTERRERTMVQSLHRQGFFTAGAKVGLMIYDAPAVRDGVERGLKPALRALGVEVASQAVYPDVIESPWDSYVLQFNTAGVTHVIFSAAHGQAAVLFFGRAAENQRYRPQYGISGPAVQTVQSGLPKEQLRNMRGVSWVPWMITGGSDSSSPVSENDAACREAMKAKGEAQTPSNLFHYCNYLFFLKHALERADALTPTGLAASVATMGTEWQSAGLTYAGATRFSARQHDAVELVRDFAWDQKGDERFVHVGPPHPAAQWDG